MFEEGKEINPSQLDEYKDSLPLYFFCGESFDISAYTDEELGEIESES